MFWSGKECKITLMTANHTRYEQLAAPNKEVLEGSKIPEWQREERQSPAHHRELLESGTKHWKVPVYTKLTLLLWPVLHRCDRLSFWFTGTVGWFMSSLSVKNPPRPYENAWKIWPSTGLSMKNETQVQKVEGKDYEENQSWKVKEHKITTGRRMSKQWHGGTTEKQKK